jgi:hypothetical protein
VIVEVSCNSFSTIRRSECNRDEDKIASTMSVHLSAQK